MSLELKEQYEKIYSFCYFKVHIREVAEDITQETFLKYFSATEYLEKGKKLAFLYTIARNLCADYFRKNREIETTDDLPELYEENAAAIETALAVRTAVSKLSIEQQELVLLRFAHELSIGALSDYFGISRFALYRKISALEKELKRYLREEDFYG